jgi:hypothetical protein
MPHGRPRRNKLRNRSFEEVVDEAAQVAIDKGYPEYAVKKAKELSQRFRDVVCNRRCVFYSMLYMVLRYEEPEYSLYRMHKELGVSPNTVRKYMGMLRGLWRDPGE